MNEMSMHERLARLEQANHRLKLGMLAMVALIASLVLLGAAAPEKILSGEGLVLRDAAGHQQVIVRTHALGPLVTLFDAAAKERVIIGNSFITLNDAQARRRAILQVEGPGPHLGLFDSQGKARASIGLVNDRPRIILYDVKGAAVFRAP